MSLNSDSFPHAGTGPSGADHLDVPDTSMLPGSDKAPTASADMIRRVAQGAHSTIDRFADQATPPAQRLEKGLSSAGAALHAGADQLRQTRDDWTEGLRCTVRANPLAALAVAVAIGALVARVTR
jgi:ABC-type transporter Mla subunit MlaD